MHIVLTQLEELIPVPRWCAAAGHTICQEMGLHAKSRWQTVHAVCESYHLISGSTLVGGTCQVTIPQHAIEVHLPSCKNSNASLAGDLACCTALGMLC